MSAGAEATTEGSALRQQLEQALQVNQALRNQLVTNTVAGLKFVKPEDLKEVPPDQFQSKANELEQARAAERQQVVREALLESGLSEAQVEATLAGKPAEQPAPSQPTSQLASVGRLQAGAPSGAPQQELWGPSKLRAAFGNTK